VKTTPTLLAGGMRAWISGYCALMNLKQARSEWVDRFTSLDNPTFEPAREYKKLDHQCATAIGIACSIIRRYERWKQMFKKED
jgi:hypothetical protein